MTGNDNTAKEREIAALLRQTAEAHGVYEHDVLNDQYDVEWPKWYGEYLLDNGLPALLGKGEDGAGLKRPLDEVLSEADVSHRANAPGEIWQEYYARYLLEKAETL
jgi:hypothetical protein